MGERALRFFHHIEFAPNVREHPVDLLDLRKKIALIGRR